MTDEEFGREMIAGVNPCVIHRLQVSPDVIFLSFHVKIVHAWHSEGRIVVSVTFPYKLIFFNEWQEFPPQSKLDPSVYGDQTSKMTKEQLEINLEGLTVDKAMIDVLHFNKTPYEIFFYSKCQPYIF